MNTIVETVLSPGDQQTVLEEKKQGFGTFIGVFVPSILMVFGVIIFLRLGWIVGHAGMPLAFLIISFASLIAFVTTLSMASISTNIEVGKGGVYYLLSRSLGIEVGSAIGLPLYFKQCLSVAFCVMGFAESLHDLIPALSITSIGIVTLIVLTLFAYFSLSGALRVQLFIFAVLACSFASLFLGGNESIAVNESMPNPGSYPSIGFWTLFAIFFPAMTGIESSVSLSGDLRNPGRSLPLGTISSIVVAYLIYLSIALFLVRNVSLERLIQEPFIMLDLAKFPSLIILGIWGATISSALGGLLGAPRTLQALAEDRVVPKIFGKNFGKMQEPRIATLTTCLIALVGVYFGSVNMIAPLLTMICLICYAVLNFSAGLETLMANPSWRPRFQINWMISIFGGVLCLIAMIMIDPGYSMIASAIVLLIYLIAKRRKYQSSWEDIREGILLFFSRFAIYHLAKSDLISKSWRPHFLVFAKSNEGSLLQLSQAISQGKGFITMASFLTNPLKNEQVKREQNKIRNQLNKQHIQALVHLSYAEKIYLSMNQMIENYGLGPLKPNTVICGIHKDEDLENLASVIINAHEKHCNFLILNSQDDTIESKIPPGDIHIWWHSSHKDNGEFMLILAYMLNRNSEWKRAKICLKSIVSSELIRQEKLKEFQEISTVKRIPLEIEILVSPNPDEDYLEYAATFSKNASLALLSVEPPTTKASSDEYRAYLSSMMSFSQQFTPAVLVLGSKFTPSENILT